MRNALRNAYRGSSWLTVMAVAMTALAVLAAFGLVVDDRTVLGQPTWMKPFKFGTSFAVYAMTLAWLLSFVKPTLTKKIAVGLIVVGSYLEVALIVWQAARGRASHFHVETALDNAIWSAMGAMAGLFGVGTAIVAIVVWRSDVRSGTAKLAAKVGLLLLLAGMGQAALMVVPTKEQRRLDEIQDQPMLGAHSVGVPDGGAGLPITGWSTTGGDLRVGHFVGVHGLQAMIVLAMLFPGRPGLIKVAGGAYAGLLALVTWQALRGQPLTRPDALTLTAAGVLVVATTVGLLTVDRKARV
ncbi:MAG: hypothetical protein HOU81_07250 [Hamadaea sp.]|uniref:hypothetical protein n=1 Tax=Hamadaea sp. TaxID=2024425 RepID=UPI0017A2C9F1|nr:hypothetical protein [Hamadaea sp.]NUR70600.1 hypothetical protein [Hamadaea sp.]NUT19271.1 hypothetical protein [Hamadaea sp.]